MLWAQPKPIITPFPAGEPANDVLVQPDDLSPNPPPAIGGFQPGLGFGGGLGGLNRESASQVSVLCFKDPDQKALGETIEDLAVLSVLLSRNLEQSIAGENDEYKLGIPMLLTAGKQAVTASYIQGFGALLKMQVRFPLVAPPEGLDGAQAEQKNSEWEQARRELFDATPEVQWDAGAPGMGAVRTDARPYDAKLVQTLKKRVLVLLKNAAHVRHLDGNEWLIVKIVGTPNAQKPMKTATINGRSFDADNEQLNGSESIPTATAVESGDAPPPNPTPTKKSRKHASANNRATTVTADDVPTSNRATIMSLRVRKSAVDAFETGALSEEQFIKGAEVATYLNPALPGASARNTELRLK